MKFYHCYCRSNAVHGSGQKKIVYVILIIAELAGGRPTAKPTLHEFTLRPTSPLILSVDLLVTRIAALDAFTKTLFDGCMALYWGHGHFGPLVRFGLPLVLISVPDLS